MEIKQNWAYTNLEFYLLKDYIKPITGLYILVGLNGEALESVTGYLMDNKLKVHYTLDPSAFPSYDHPNLTKEETISEMRAFSKMCSDFYRLKELWLSSKRDNEFESTSFMIDWALSKKYKPEWLDWAIEKQLYIPNQGAFIAGVNTKVPTARQNYAAICRQYAQEFIDTQHEMPKMKAIALHVHLRMKDEQLYAPRGDYWTTETIAREALVGITGRKANGKK